MKIHIKDSNSFKKLLLEKGYSQRSFSEVIEVSPTYFNQIINGERFPSGKIAKKICDVFEMEFGEIFFIDDVCKSYQE